MDRIKVEGYVLCIMKTGSEKEVGTNLGSEKEVRTKPELEV